MKAFEQLGASGKYQEALEQARRFTEIVGSHFGENSKEYAFGHNMMGRCFMSLRKYEEAEIIFKRSISIFETLNDAGSQGLLGATLVHLADLYALRDRSAEGEPLLKRNLAIAEKIYGKDDARLVEAIRPLSRLYMQTLARYPEAELLDERRLRLIEKTEGSESFNYAVALGDLATLYLVWGHFAKAEPLYQRALIILEKNWDVTISRFRRY
jgi:tetratricopeptide (TPR) repeat protein